MIVSRDEQDVKHTLTSLDNNTKKCGMQISYEKTEILVIDQPEKDRIKDEFIMINDNRVNIVNCITHLGRITDNGLGETKRHKQNVTNRINKARGCFKKYLYTIFKNMYVSREGSNKSKK